MDSFTERATNHISQAIEDKDIHGVSNGFTIQKSEAGNWVIHTSLVTEEPPDIFGDSESNSGDPDVTWGEVYESFQLPLPDELEDECISHTERVSSSIVVGEDAFIDTPIIECYDDVSSVRVDWEVRRPSGEFNFEGLANAIVNAEHAPISDKFKITSIEIRQPLADSSDDSMMFPDYTVQYETQTPHESWGNLSSLDEYAEQVAENNEEYTVEDVLNWETYTSHFHLTGQVTPNKWLRKNLPEVISRNISLKMGGGTRYVSELNAERGSTVSVTGSVVWPLPD